MRVEAVEHPLGRIGGVARRRESERPSISARHDEKATTALGDTMIGRVEHRVAGSIARTGLSVDALDRGQQPPEALVLAAIRQGIDVLDEDRSRAYFADDAEHGRKRVGTR